MRYRITISTGDVDEDTFHRMLHRVFKALRMFQSVTVRFDEVHPDENGSMNG